MRPLVPMLIMCFTAILSVALLTETYKGRNRSNDVLVVTGLSKRDFDSDLVVWKGSFVRRGSNMKAAYQNLARDLEIVKKFCLAHGLSEKEIVFSSVDLEKEFDDMIDKERRTKRVLKGYALTQHVRIESNDVDRIERFSREVTRILDEGVEFYAENPGYYYTKLGELKLEMIAAATRDGRARAERIIQNAGGKLGPLRYSNVGVFQITAPNSNAESSWSGAFDESSRRKTATVTIKLQFGLQ